MSLPPPLTAAIATCRLQLQEHALHWLPLGRREFVYHYLGAGPDAHLGFQRQCCLSFLSAESQLPVWNRMFDGDDFPEVVLGFARKLLQEGPDSGMPTHRPDLLDRAFRDLPEKFPESKSVVPAGYACVATLRQVMRDERFAFGEPDHSRLDEEMPPNLRDASFYAECTAAGGPYWWEGSDAGKRLTFWTKWLEEMVPRAYALEWD